VGELGEMGCAGFAGVAEELAFGVLTGRERAEALAHLDRCAACREDARLAALSAREREVLLDMATGLTNSEIAAHLSLSESTVKTHVSRVLAKTGARDRVHAVIIAYDAGLVRPGQVPWLLRSSVR